MQVQGFFGQNTNSQNIVNAAETILVTVGPLSIPRDSAVQVIIGQMNWNEGSGDTNYNYRVRRGTTITDPLIGVALNQGFTAGAGLNWIGNILVMDLASALAGVFYSLTVQRNVGTDTRACSFAALAVLSLY